MYFCEFCLQLINWHQSTPDSGLNVDSLQQIVDPFWIIFYMYWIPETFHYIALSMSEWKHPHIGIQIHVHGGCHYIWLGWKPFNFILLVKCPSSTGKIKSCWFMWERWPQSAVEATGEGPSGYFYVPRSFSNSGRYYLLVSPQSAGLPRSMPNTDQCRIKASCSKTLMQLLTIRIDRHWSKLTDIGINTRILIGIGHCSKESWDC